MPIDAGGRVTGRIGSFTLGGLDMQSSKQSGSSAPSTNFASLRVKRDLFGRSSIGLIATSRSAGDVDPSRNTCTVSTAPSRCRPRSPSTRIGPEPTRQVPKRVMASVIAGSWTTSAIVMACASSGSSSVASSIPTSVLCHVPTCVRQPGRFGLARALATVSGSGSSMRTARRHTSRTPPVRWRREMSWASRRRLPKQRSPDHAA